MGLQAGTFIFYGLAIASIFFALGVVLFSNPLYSALSLAMTMITAAALYASLGAYFIAGVQLIVYAGAVMVLFVIVLMVFNLKTEKQVFSRGIFSGAIKLMMGGLFYGILGGTIYFSTVGVGQLSELAAQQANGTMELATLLFSKYIFGFELVSVVLLMVAVGAVAISRNKGGTHV